MERKGEARKISTIPTNDSKVESYWSRKKYPRLHENVIQKELKRKSSPK